MQTGASLDTCSQLCRSKDLSYEDVEEEKCGGGKV